MMIAKRVDCYPYTFVGLDRLEMLCSATKLMKDEDPIGALLRKYKIDFDPEAEDNLQEFKAKIDAAISSERLARKSLTFDFDMIVKLHLTGIDVDNSLIKTLSNIQKCGGDPAKHLNNLILTGGKESAEEDGAKKPEDFGRLANRLIQTIDYIIKGCSREAGLLELLDKEAYSSLMEKLCDLNKVAKFTDEETAEE